MKKDWFSQDLLVFFLIFWGFYFIFRSSSLLKNLDIFIKLLLFDLFLDFYFQFTMFESLKFLPYLSHPNFVFSRPIHDLICLKYFSDIFWKWCRHRHQCFRRLRLENNKLLISKQELYSEKMQGKYPNLSRVAFHKLKIPFTEKVVNSLDVHFLSFWCLSF